jgi:hypothetical protein
LIYKDETRAVNTVGRIYKSVIDHPDWYSDYITLEQVREVQTLTLSRASMMLSTGHDKKKHELYGVNKNVKAIIASPIEDQKRAIEDLTNKAANLLNLKYSTIKSKKDVKNLDIKKLTDVFTSLMQQYRLSNNEATEHVAVVVKQQGIDKLGEKELIDLLAKSREANNAS